MTPAPMLLPILFKKARLLLLPLAIKSIPTAAPKILPLINRLSSRPTFKTSSRTFFVSQSPYPKANKRPKLKPLLVEVISPG